jgi:hypothetical protein
MSKLPACPFRAVAFACVPTGRTFLAFLAFFGYFIPGVLATIEQLLLPAAPFLHLSSASASARS